MTNARKRIAATGLLLAGGLSSRLGQPKALLDFGGRPLGRHLLDRLARVTVEQVIVTNDPEQYLHWGARIAGDPPEYRGMGPLAGLLAGLDASTTGTIIAVACDLPFFSPELAAHMLEILRAESPDAVVPAHDGYVEPLLAAYTAACREPMRRQLAAGNRRVADIFPHIRVRYLPEDGYRRFGDTGRLFFNINSPGDLAAARAMWSQETT
jgi:molybdopterin-guanine dinucleotide biosynthesis protein A